MIVKITILRFLDSSDDKEKIGITRPEGQELKRPWRNPSRKDQDEDNLLSPVKPMMSKLHSSVQWTWHRINRRWVFTLTGVMDLEDEEITGVLQAPVKPTIKAKWASVQLSRDSVFRGVSEITYAGWTDIGFWERRSIDQIAVGTVTASCWENTLTG